MHLVTVRFRDDVRSGVGVWKAGLRVVLRILVGVRVIQGRVGVGRGSVVRTDVTTMHEDVCRGMCEGIPVRASICDLSPRPMRWT